MSVYEWVHTYCRKKTTVCSDDTFFQILSLSVKCLLSAELIIVDPLLCEVKVILPDTVCIGKPSASAE